MMSVRRERSRRKGKVTDEESDCSERQLQILSNKKKRITGSHSRRREHRRRKSRSRSRSPHRSAKRRRHRSSSEKNPRRKRRRKSKRHKEERKKLIKKRHSDSKHPTKNEEKKPKPSHLSTDSQNPSQALSPLKTDIEKENPYDNSDTESELNLENAMERIVDYIDDKKELCHQTFKTLKGRKLRTMIPEILRSYNLVELRDMCHKELDGMSKKRVLRILNGDEPEIISSSSSSTSGNYLKSSPMEYDSAMDTSMDSRSGHSKSNDSLYSSSSTRSISPEYRSRKEQRKKGKKVKHDRRNSKEKMSTPEAVVDSTCKIEETIPEDELDQEKGEDDESVCESNNVNENVKEVEDVPQDVLEVTATDLNQDLDQELTHEDSCEQSIREPHEDTESNRDRSVVISQCDDNVIQQQRSKKKELEIIELEMRARAIRSMINAQTKDPRLRLKKV